MFGTPKNARVFVIYRRSTKEQADSIDRQRDQISTLTRELGYIVHGELVLDDHSATAGQQWAALYGIIRRKRDGESFEAVVASEYSRVGRTMDETEQFHRDLRDVGLKLITRQEGMLSGKDASMKRIFTALSNEKYAESLSTGSNGGAVQLMKRDAIPTSTAPIFGLDWMHISSKGEPLFRLRWTSDDRLLKLTPHEPCSELEEYAGEQRRNYPRRQGGHRIVLMPGASACVEAVRRVFHLRYVEGYGYTTIAKIMIAEGHPSPRAHGWKMQGVVSLLKQRRYLGVGTHGEEAWGSHSTRTKNGYRLFDEVRRPGVNDLGVKRKSVPYTKNPIGDWYLCKLPQLVHILPAKIRRRAKAVNRMARQRKKRPAFAQYGTGELGYFLTGLIWNMAADRRMHGTNSKKNGLPYYRYYRATPDVKQKPTPGIYKGIDADATEATFKRLVSMLLSNRPDLEGRMKAALVRRRSLAEKDGGQGEKLLNEQKRLRAHLEWILNAGPDAAAVAARKVSDLSQRLAVIAEELAASTVVIDPMTNCDVDFTAKRLASSLVSNSELLANASTISLRKLALLLVERIDFDPTALTLLYRLRLPESCVVTPETVRDVFREGSAGYSTSLDLTKRGSALFLGEFAFKVGPTSISPKLRRVVLEPLFAMSECERVVLVSQRESVHK